MPEKTTLNTENPRLAAMLETMIPRSKESDLAQEVTALRKEISALRRDLASPSFLVTGRAAINEFNKLSRVPHTQ